MNISIFQKTKSYFIFLCLKHSIGKKGIKIIESSKTCVRLFIHLLSSQIHKKIFHPQLLLTPSTKINIGFLNYMLHQIRTQSRIQSSSPVCWPSPVPCHHYYFPQCPLSAASPCWSEESWLASPFPCLCKRWCPFHHEISPPFCESVFLPLLNIKLQ